MVIIDRKKMSSGMTLELEKLRKEGNGIIEMCNHCNHNYSEN